MYMCGFWCSTGHRQACAELSGKHDEFPVAIELLCGVGGSHAMSRAVLLTGTISGHTTHTGQPQLTQEFLQFFSSTNGSCDDIPRATQSK